MSFRSRLRLFFGIIVLVPMAAAALVLFWLTGDSERGKADARLAQALETADAVHEQAVARGRVELRALAADRALGRAVADGSPAAARRLLARAVDRRPAVEAVELYDADNRLVARAGAPDAVAYATAHPRRAGGEGLGTLAVSTTPAARLAREIARLSQLEVRLTRGDRMLATTLGERERAGEDLRGRVVALGAGPGPPVRIALLHDAGDVEGRIAEGRLRIAAILIAFLLLALLSSVFVVRALQAQIAHFLAAARRIGEGDFSRAIPVEGSDEFAALGQEFNRMSFQLAGKIEEVERKRHELEQAIRRVGDAFAAGLDREGVVELAVMTALDALGAHAGRAVPVDPDKMPGARAGAADPRLIAALEAAERRAFAVDPDFGIELLANLDTSIEPPAQRRPVAAEVDGVHSLALPLRAHLGGGGELRYVGVVSIAREGAGFSDAERDLFGYLAGQAVVSIENVDLHETVQLQAVTDELTRLFNVRHFHDRLDDEIERSRRFGTSIGLVMLDIDDFKRVNDTHGHQQGDLVLVEVARIVREHSRDIDVPARYGGEELTLVLPQTDLEGAEQAAERIRVAIAALRVQNLDGGPALTVTASFGVASLPASATTKEALVAAADAALYRAKRAGKNRVARAEAIPA